MELPKGRKSSNFVTILMKRTRLLNNLKDMFRQLLCHRQFTDEMTIYKSLHFYGKRMRLWLVVEVQEKTTNLSFIYVKGEQFEKWFGDN